jgi:hypothetical protein
LISGKGAGFSAGNEKPFQNVAVKLIHLGHIFVLPDIIRLSEIKMRTSLNIMSLCMIAVLMVAALSVHARGDDARPAETLAMFP